MAVPTAVGPVERPATVAGRCACVCAASAWLYSRGPLRLTPCVRCDRSAPPRVRPRLGCEAETRRRAAARGRAASAPPAECGVVLVVVDVSVAPIERESCSAGLLRRRDRGGERRSEAGPRPKLTVGLLSVEGLLRRAAEGLPEGL